jgi:putative ABC transport system permease protein
MSIDLILNGLQQGLILVIIAYGIMIPLRFLNFSDMTADGAYPLGGAICAIAMLAGVSPPLTIPFAMICAGIIGACAAIIHLKLRVNSMLAGIILNAMAYSINLRIMGKPNIALFNYPGLFGANIGYNMFLIVAILIVCLIPFAMFLRTDFGLRFRAVGLNPGLAKLQGISVEKYTILGLFLAGALFGLAGSLMVQIQNYMDIGMGIGIMIHALASLMIGETIVGNTTLNQQLVAPAIGALIYQQIQGLALSFGLAPSDLKFFTGVVILTVVSLEKKDNY